MAGFVVAAKTSDIPPGHMKAVTVDGKQIAIANVDGEFFAIDDLCTHAQCSLGGEGILDGNVVTCGCHGSQFDVMTGKVLVPPAVEAETSYKTKIEGENILVYV